MILILAQFTVSIPKESQKLCTSQNKSKCKSSLWFPSSNRLTASSRRRSLKIGREIQSSVRIGTHLTVAATCHFISIIILVCRWCILLFLVVLPTCKEPKTRIHICIIIIMKTATIKIRLKTAKTPSDITDLKTPTLTITPNSNLGRAKTSIPASYWIIQTGWFGIQRLRLMILVLLCIPRRNQVRCPLVQVMAASTPKRMTKSMIFRLRT